MANDEAPSAKITRLVGRHGHRLDPPRQFVALCERTRLLRSLGIARAGKLSLLVAPPGYGKTTLLAQWAGQLRAEGANVVWLTLSARESDPAAFLRMLAFALHSGGIDMQDTGMLGGADVSIDSGLDTLAFKLEQTPNSVVIMLDDFDMVQGTTVPKLLDELIELLPDQAHVVIAARRRPTFATSGLAQGNVRILEANELQLNSEEVSELLAGELESADIATLEQWTEGWPVAVQLFRLWLQKTGALETIPTVWPVNTMTDYLAEQIFDMLPVDQQTFLSEALVLEDIEPELADHIREASDSLQLLRALQSHLPSLVETVSPGAASRFRLHPLVARAARGYFPLSRERLHELNMRASRWCLDQHRYVEAIRYAVASKDETLVQNTVKSLLTLNIFLEHGGAELRALVRELPRRIRENDPNVQLMYALIHFKSGFIREGKEALDRMVLPALPATDGAHHADDARLSADRMALQTMYRVYTGDDGDVPIDVALDQLRGVTDADPLIWAWRVNLQTVMLEQRGQLNQAREGIAQCEALYDAYGLHWASFALMPHHIIIDLAEGALRAVTTGVGQMLKRRRSEYCGAASILAMGNLAEAVVGYERGQQEGIESAILRALQNFEEGESWAEHRAIAAPVVCELAYQRGGVEAVEEFLHTLRQWLAERGICYFDKMLPALQAHYLAQSGRAADSEELIRSNGLDLQDGQAFPERLWREWDVGVTALIQHAMATGNWTTARVLAGQLAAKARGSGRLRGQISGLIFSAVCSRRLGDGAKAASDTLSAIRLAYPDQYAAPFMEAGPDALALLEELENVDLSPLEKRHVDAVIKCFLRIAPDHPYGLSNREMAILRNLADGASNKLIARRLAITENTVKFHLKRIFNKIGVTNRRAASALFDAHIAGESAPLEANI